MAVLPEQGILSADCETTLVGDLVFFRGRYVYHVAPVTETGDNGWYIQIEALPRHIIVMETWQRWKKEIQEECVSRPEAARLGDKYRACGCFALFGGTYSSRRLLNPAL